MTQSMSCYKRKKKTPIFKNETDQKKFSKVAKNNLNGTHLFYTEISYSSNGIASKPTFLLCHLKLYFSVTFILNAVRRVFIFIAPFKLVLIKRSQKQCRFWSFSLLNGISSRCIYLTRSKRKVITEMLTCLMLLEGFIQSINNCGNLL